MTREELVTSPEYWTSNAQIDLFDCALKFMKEHNMNRKQLAEYLGVSKSYVTQLFNGEFDHRLSKFMELTLSFGYVPKISFIPKEDFVHQDIVEQVKWSEVTYNIHSECQCRTIQIDDEYSQARKLEEEEAA